MTTSARTGSGGIHDWRHSAHPGFVFLRFGTLSLVAAVLDNLVFYLIYQATGWIAAAQIVARVLSLSFSYHLARRLVFCGGHLHRIALPKYLLLAAANLVVSYAGIRVLAAQTQLAVPAAKILVETVLFAANFAIQRTLIFRNRA